MFISCFRLDPFFGSFAVCDATWFITSSSRSLNPYRFRIEGENLKISSLSGLFGLTIFIVVVLLVVNVAEKMCPTD